MLVIGGVDDKSALNTVDVLTINDTTGQTKWSPGFSLNEARAEACGGVLVAPITATYNEEYAVVAGGRGFNSTTISSSIEFIGPDGLVVTSRLFLSLPRFGCAGVSSAARDSVFIVGGVSKQTDASGVVTYGVVDSIERVCATGVTSFGSLGGSGRSHVAVVEAPPYAFFVGGNGRRFSASNPLPFDQQPVGDVAVMNLTDGSVDASLGLTLRVCVGNVFRGLCWQCFSFRFSQVIFRLHARIRWSLSRPRPQ